MREKSENIIDFFLSAVAPFFSEKFQYLCLNQHIFLGFESQFACLECFPSVTSETYSVLLSIRMGAIQAIHIVCVSRAILSYMFIPFCI